MHAVVGSGQTGRASGKYWFVGRFIFCTAHIILLWIRNERKEHGQGMWHVVGQEKCLEGFGGET